MLPDFAHVLCFIGIKEENNFVARVSSGYLLGCVQERLEVAGKLVTDGWLVKISMGSVYLNKKKTCGTRNTAF